MDKVDKYTIATNNKYFSNDEFNFEELADITSIKFIAELKGKLMLNKIERLSIKQYTDDSKLIYIFVTEYDWINDYERYMILDCYYIAYGYYRINYINSNALKALDLTVKQL